MNNITPGLITPLHCGLGIEGQGYTYTMVSIFNRKRETEKERERGRKDREIAGKGVSARTFMERDRKRE